MQSKLNLAANIGSQIAVTFMNAREGIQTQERINGQRAFLDSRSSKARPGDTCLVQVVGMNPRQTVYFVKVVRPLKMGNGKFSILEKCLLKDNDHRPVQEAIRQLGNDEKALCDTLLLMVEAFVSNWEEYCQWGNFFEDELFTACTPLIGKVHADDHKARAEALLALGSFASKRHRADEGRRLLHQSLDICDEHSLDLVGSVLDSLEKHYDKHCSRSEESWRFQILKRQIALHEANGKCDVGRRLTVASLFEGCNRSRDVLDILEPLDEGNAQIRHTLLGYRGRAYHKEGMWAEAEDHLTRSVDETYPNRDSLDALAEFYAQQNKPEKAVEVYRKLVAALKEDLANSDERF